MCLGKNVVRRNGAVYYVRVAVPRDLQASIGKRERWVSLQTKDWRDAKRLAPRVLDQIQTEFEERRRRLAPRDFNVQRLVWEFYQRELEIDRSGRLSAPDLPRVDPAIRAMLREGHEAELRKHVANGESVLIQWAADEIAEREGFGFGRDSRQYADLCQGLQRGLLEASRRFQERDEGRFDGKPSDPLVAPPTGSEEPSEAKPGERIMEVYEIYASEAIRYVKPDTLDQNRKAVQLFAEFLGEKKSASAITKKTAREWKQELRRWPKKAAEISEFRGLPFKQVIQANERLGKATISDRTINKYLSALGGFCEWLRVHDYIAENVVNGMSLKLDKSKSAIRPYTSAELTDLFSSPVYVGCRSDETDHEPGNYRITDHRYWLPLIALFSGARLGEIAQLLVADVKQLDGHWIIDITTDGSEEKKLKAKGSRRVVPMHPQLVKLGLLEYRRRMEAKGELRLFPEVNLDTRGFFGHASRWYGRYIKRIGLKHDKSLNFHSLRHGFFDALRRAGYQKHEYMPLVGHAGSTTSDRYGAESDLNLQRRAQMVAAVDYPGLDLSHLYLQEKGELRLRRAGE